MAEKKSSPPKKPGRKTRVLATEEPDLDASVLKMPTLRGSGQLNELLHVYGGEERVCKDFLLAPDLLRAYLTGEMEPPRTLLLALFWQGPYGFSQAFSDTHWTHQAMIARARVAEAKLEQHRMLLRAVAPVVKGIVILAKTYGIEDAEQLEQAARLPYEGPRPDRS